MTDRLQANIAAAKMLGWVELAERSCARCPESGAAEYVSLKRHEEFRMLCGISPDIPDHCRSSDNRYYPDAYFRTFDIFTNPSDCLAAVKCLGVNYDIGICPGVEQGKFIPLKTGCCINTDGDFITYEEAVGAACIEVMKS